MAVRGLAMRMWSCAGRGPTTAYGAMWGGARAMSSGAAPEPMRVMLGLDLSTRVTGFVFLTKHGDFVDGGRLVTPRTCTDVLDTGAFVRSELVKWKSLVEEGLACPIEWDVCMEDFLRAFSFASRASTLFPLAQLNGIVSFAVWDVFGVKPLYVHPTSARSFFALNRAREGESSDVKVRVHEWAKPMFPPDFEWVTNKLGRFCATNYDTTDAMLVAQYGLVEREVQRLMRDESGWEAYWERYTTRNRERMAKEDSALAGAALTRARNKRRAKVLAAYRRTVVDSLKPLWGGGRAARDAHTYGKSSEDHCFETTPIV